MSKNLEGALFRSVEYLLQLRGHETEGEARSEVQVYLELLQAARYQPEQQPVTPEVAGREAGEALARWRCSMTEEQRQEWHRVVELCGDGEGAPWMLPLSSGVILAVHAEIEALRRRVAELEPCERCEGLGEIPSEVQPLGLISCPDCEGHGYPYHRRVDRTQ